MINKLKLVANKFDESSRIKKGKYLSMMAGKKLPENKKLVKYYDLLLFVCAHPDDNEIHSLAEKELARITAYMKRSAKRTSDVYMNSGLPYSICYSSFSHDLIHWLINYKGCKIELHSYDEAILDLNDILKLTLPKIEKSKTTIGLNNEGLLESLSVKEKDQISFLVNELSKLNQLPYIKDHLFEGVGIRTDIILKDKSFSKAYNRIENRTKYFHKDILKQFDHIQIINSPIPGASKLSVKFRSNLTNVIKKTLVLTDRETDPVTYMDENSLRLYDLERGISVAIYGMIPERQLPMESYVGYMLFKNGFTAAYGGGWVFGKRSDFGISIFEPFRGGESGYLMCALLRVYSQVFNVSSFEIEPYQFGLDNPEGIESGAFWFYFRYGFRPLNKEILKISLSEQKKINNRKDYRTGKNILEKFTHSPLVLNLDSTNPMKVGYITEKVTRMIARNYNGNRVAAVHDCIKKFRSKSGLKSKLNNSELNVLEDVALWTQALNVKSTEEMRLFVKMLKTKPTDLYAYQQLLLQLFKNN